MKMGLSFLLKINPTTALLFLSKICEIVLKYKHLNNGNFNKQVSKTKGDENHPLNRTFKTAYEAAKAKTDFIMNTVFKDVGQK
jgi:hypothetical protein